MANDESGAPPPPTAGATEHEAPEATASTGVKAGTLRPAPEVGAPTGADDQGGHMDAYHLTRRLVRAVIEACAKSEGFGSYATSDWDVPEADLMAEWAPRVLDLRRAEPMPESGGGASVGTETREALESAEWEIQGIVGVGLDTTRNEKITRVFRNLRALLAKVPSPPSHGSSDE